MSDLFNGTPEEKQKKENTVLKDLTEEPAKSEKARLSLKSFLKIFKIHKSPGKKAHFKFNTKLLFVLLLIICIALFVLTAVNKNFAKPFKTAASVIIIPAQKGINEIGTWFNEKLDNLKTVEELNERIDELESEVNELKAENTLLSEQNTEAERLNDLLELKDQYGMYETTGAKIISMDSSNWTSEFIINKGSEDGIEKNMNVVATGGLVGVVTDVGINYSTVKTIIDDESNVSAVIEGQTDTCIVRGNLSTMENGVIGFTDISVLCNINTGDALVTSSVSSIYQPGLLIGYVTDCSVDGNELTQSGHLTPAVDFEQLSEVLVITELKETQD